MVITNESLIERKTEPNKSDNLLFLFAVIPRDVIFNEKTASPCIPRISSTWTQGPVSTRVSYLPSTLSCVSINGKNIARILFYTKVRKFKVIVAIPTTSWPLSSYEFLLLLISALNFYALKYIKAICLPYYCCGICLQFMLQGSPQDCDTQNTQNSSLSLALSNRTHLLYYWSPPIKDTIHFLNLLFHIQGGKNYNTFTFHIASLLSKA